MQVPLIPNRPDIAENTPLSLAEAAELAFPGGGHDGERIAARTRSGKARDRLHRWQGVHDSADDRGDERAVPGASERSLFECLNEGGPPTALSRAERQVTSDSRSP